MVRTAPTDKNRNYDIWLETIIVKQIKKSINVKDDDFLMLIAGPTGTGKSHLMLHTYECYDPEGCSVDYISLSRSDFADSLKNVNAKQGLKFVSLDEANISKRDSMTKWNKDLLDLYFSIRGKNIFHVWCNPSIDMIDKPFLEEKIKGLIYITSKGTKGRIYYYFTKKRLLKVFEKYGDLKLKTIHKVRKKYCLYRGWFKAYDGKLLKPYLEKKGSRMSDKIDTFYETYGSKETDNLIPRAKLTKMLLSKSSTFQRHHKDLVKQGLLVEGEQFFINAAGRYLYNESAIAVFKSSFENKKNNGIKKMRGWSDE